MYYKYRLQKKQVSYDSGSTWSDVTPLETRLGEVVGTYDTYSDCISGSSTLYQWVNMDISTTYVCVGYDKHYKQKKQVSYDGGSTWSDVVPAEYQTGATYETDSTDCGYVPPTPSPYLTQYLTIESLEDNNTVLWRNLNGNFTKTISASTDNGQSWTAFTSTSGSSGRTIATLNTGDKVLLKGLNERYYPIPTGTSVPSGDGNRLNATKGFNVYGNIMSLVSGDSFTSATSVSSHAFRWFFYSSNVVSAENLVLPATTLTEYCYSGMFNNCYYLTKAPLILPATTLASNCYYTMFRECTSLTVAPQLPATTLAEKCYSYMFDGSVSLETAPVLPASTLVYLCYQCMFRYCSSVNYIKCLATDISATSCTLSWVDGVASTGTFVKASGMSNWTTGYDGIPQNWTVQNA